MNNLNNTETLNYRRGFISACVGCGLDKEASYQLYKEARSAKQLSNLMKIFTGFKDIGKGLWGAASGTAKGTKEIMTGLGKAFKTTNKAVGVGAYHANHWLARQFSRGLLHNIPLLKSFGKGFSKAQYTAERLARVAAKGKKGKKALKDVKNIGSLLGLGKGSFLGNTLHGMGSFTAEHPLLGMAMYTAPAASLAIAYNNSNQENASIDTLTPAQRKLYERDYNAAGYRGLGYDTRDISDFISL